MISELSQKEETIRRYHLHVESKVWQKWICLQCRKPRFDPWVRKIPWRRKWQPPSVFLPVKSHWQRNIVARSPCSSTLTYIYPRKVKTYVHTKMCINTNRSTIHNSQKVEAIQVSIKWWVVYAYNEMFVNHKCPHLL